MNKFCTQCGKPIEPGDRFCSSCGAQLEGTESAELDHNEKKAEKPPKENEEKKKSGISKFIKWFLIVSGVLTVLFIALVVFLIGSFDASLTAREFSGNYSGTMYIDEIEFGLGEDQEVLISLVGDIGFPVMARIVEDETNDGVWIMLNPATLEEESNMIFGGEYDQILGDYEDPSGSKEYIQALVDLESEPIALDGYYERINADGSVRIVYRFEMVEQSVLMPKNPTAAYDQAGYLINSYLDGLIEDNSNSIEDNSGSIEDNSNSVEEYYEENGQDNVAVSDEHGFDQSVGKIHGYIPVRIVGDSEPGYIIFSRGQAPDSGYMPPVEFDMEGWAFVMLGEDPILVQYEGDDNIYSINRYIVTESDEVYIDGSREIVKMIYNDELDMEIDADGVHRPIYKYETQSQLPGGTYQQDTVIVFSGKVSNGNLIGSLQMDDLITGESFVIEFEEE